VMKEAFGGRIETVLWVSEWIKTTWKTSPHGPILRLVRLGERRHGPFMHLNYYGRGL
jgi:hypothetical protein